MKVRLDKLLVDKELAANLKDAASLIMSERVYTDNKILNKAGMIVNKNISIYIKDAKPHGWVSRGGIKLQHALDNFKISPKNLICMDVGCSTGGFSDVLITNGASKIYAVDVGYGEFAWKLRNNHKIILLERTNARFLNSNQITDSIDLVVCDASFIRLKSILPKPLSFTKSKSKLIALIKPQFEINKSQLENKAIVTSPILHNEVIQSVKDWLIEIGWNILDIIESPITGAKGNKEFLIGATYG